MSQKKENRSSSYTLVWWQRARKLDGKLQRHRPFYIYVDNENQDTKTLFQPEMKYYNTWIALSWALSAWLTQMYAPNHKVFSIKQYQLLPNHNYHIKAKVYVVSSSLFYFIRASHLSSLHFHVTKTFRFIHRIPTVDANLL